MAKRKLSPEHLAKLRAGRLKAMEAKEPATTAPEPVIAAKPVEPESFGILTPEEIEQAKQAARTRVSADAKKDALAKITEAETRRLKQKTGNGYKDEEVSIYIDLAPFADRIVIDNETFLQGHTYKRPRHVVESMREMIQRGWDHEADIKGESMRQKLGQFRTQNFDKIEGLKVSEAA